MNEKRKFILISVFSTMVIAVLGVVFYYVYQGINYVTTEDARVSGDIARVSPKIVGELEEFNVEEGQYVEKGQLLALQSIENIQDSNIDRALIKAPIRGKIIKKQGIVGENVAPGQILVMIVDPKKLYITANIEETKITKIKPGQNVDITIDEFGKRPFKGKIKAIGQAAASTFSIFPNSSGTTFTKITQKIPVDIIFEHDDKVLIGTNAIVKIHVN